MLNGKPMLQRPIAVDWAVPKKEFEEKCAMPEKREIKEEEGYNEMLSFSHIQGDSDEEEDEELASQESVTEDEETEDQSSNGDDGDVFEEDEKPERRFGEPRPTWKTGHDVSENKTVYVRNLNFESDQDDLRNLMEEHFGKVLFAVLVMDKVTERPKVTFLRY